jgi:hypothetical protein
MRWLCGFVVLLTLLVSFSSEASAQTPGGDVEHLPQDDPNNPILPLYSSRPEEGGFWIAGGSNPAFSGGSWWRIGYRFASGDDLDVLVTFSRFPAISYRRTFHETECFRASAVAGTRGGWITEYYLGSGFAALLDVGRVTRSPRIMLVHYPIEGVNLSVGFDLLGFKPCYEWGLFF